VEWHSTESREAAAAALLAAADATQTSAAVSNLVHALRTRNVAIMRKADFFMLCRLWRLRSDVWRRARAAPARRVRSGGRSSGGAGRRAAGGAATPAAAAGGQPTRRRSGRRAPRRAPRAAAAPPDDTARDLHATAAPPPPPPLLFPLSAATPPSLHELWHAPHEAAPPPWHFEAPHALPPTQVTMTSDLAAPLRPTSPLLVPAAAGWLLSPYGGARAVSLLTAGFGASTSQMP
jgi:hypothetical protein